ncbi:MAG: REP-associated tyrosine transposase [bacterium]
MGIDISKPFPKRPRLKDFDYLGTYSYFITILTKNHGSHFKEVEVVRTLTDILLEEARSEKFNILACCFMPDHFHLLVIGQDDRSDARKFVRLFKQKSGYWFKKNYNKNLWHVSYYDHILRKEESIESVALYILENPVRKGLVSDYRGYPFSRSSIYG